MIAVGNTPLVEVDGIFAKLECCNPSGSIKDRIAKYILDESERLGLLRPGTKIVEATSGNTGIALGTFGRMKGYDVTIVMPENMTDERKEILRAIGVNLVLCSKEGSFQEAAAIRDQMAKENGYFNPDQFSNPLNVECHYKTTAGEILDQMRAQPGPVGALVAGVGTGGTLMGVGKRLREVYPDVKIIAVEPTESAVMSGGSSGLHGINGIGDGFIPAIVSNGEGGVHPLIDEVTCVSTVDAVNAARYLSETHGVCVGVSSGANYLAALQASEKYGLAVTVFADGYAKYVSMGLNFPSNGTCRFADRAPSLPGLESLACGGSKCRPILTAANG